MSVVPTCRDLLVTNEENFRHGVTIEEYIIKVKRGFKDNLMFCFYKLSILRPKDVR